MAQANEWDRLAYLYRVGQVELWELVRAFYILSSVGFFDDDAKQIGYGIIDNAELHNAFVLAVIKAYGDNRVSYTDISEVLGYKLKTVNSIVMRLVKRGMLEKQDINRSGTIYGVSSSMPKIPKWIDNIAASLIRIYQDEKFKRVVADECKDVSFVRGFQVMQKEVREKYYRRDKEQNATDIDE